MTTSGHYPVKIEFENKTVNTKLVVFQELNKMILSKKTLQDLGIVIINKCPWSSAKVSEKEVCSLQEENSILIPYGKGKLVMNLVSDSPSDCKVTKDSLIEEFSDVFDPRLNPMPGEKFKIELESGCKPCKVPYARHIPMAYKAKLKDELDELVKDGIISPVTIPTDWCSPIVVTKKKSSDKIRLCVDFRQLNRSVSRELYPTKSVLEACQSIEREEASIFPSLML